MKRARLKSRSAFDSFTDVNATALTAHAAEYGGPWSKFGNAGAAGTIQGNQAQLVGAAGSSGEWTVPLDRRRKILTGAVKFNTAGGGGFVFRFQDASNFWELALLPGGPNALLQKIVAGGTTVVASAAFDPGTTATWLVRIYDWFEYVRCEIQGGPILVSTDNAFLGTNPAGIFVGGGAGNTILFDNFRVDNP